MAMLVTTCPHCESQKMTFIFQGESQMMIDDLPEWNTFWICSLCDNAVIAVLVASSEIGHTHNPESLTNQMMNHYAIASMYPKLEVTAPDHIPERILDVYNEGNDCLSHHNCTSAGIMFRKVLEMTTIEIGPDDSSFRSKPLYHRIEALAATQRLPDSMRELAHEIRLGGNVAAHEETYSQKEAEEMQAFTELFLTYLFTLPHKIKESTRRAVKKRKASKKQ